MHTNFIHLTPSPMAAVAVGHHHHHHDAASFMHRRCRLRSFPYPDPSLLDLDPKPSSPNFHRSLSTPCLSSTSSSSFATTAVASSTSEAGHIARVEIIAGRRAPGVHALVVEAAVALAFGAQPAPASSTNPSGAYVLRNRSGESFAVIKPVDEEPLARWRRSVQAGETGMREAAAYLLDHGGFAGVPPTALIRISHPLFHANGNTASAGVAPGRIASIQRFVPHEFDAGDLGPSRFSISSVHRIGILDVRLLNFDRHAGNILVRKSICNDGGCSNEVATELVPIDHGLCLPELLEDPYFEWLHWPQAAVPFSETEANYISSLDPYRDAELLRSELPLLREPSIRILVLCTIFLKCAAAAGLCLADIGGMMTPEFWGLEEGPSALEALCKMAKESITTDTSSDGSLSSSPTDYQFNMDIAVENVNRFPERHIEDVLDIPLLLRSKPRTESELDGRLTIDKEEEVKVIPKCLSFSVGETNHHDGGGGGVMRYISLKEMNEEEWELFLEKFEQLLPEAFETRMRIGHMQRLGTSCEF